MLRFLIIAVSLCIAGQVTAGVVMIETPNPCYRVVKVEGNKVFLKRTGEVCIQIIGSIPVEVEDETEEVEIYINGKFWKKQRPKPYRLNSETERILKRANRTETELENKVDGLLKRAKDNKEAKETAEYYKSEEFQNKVSSFSREIEKQFGVKREKKETKENILTGDKRLYIFISSSIPVKTLRNYAIDLDYLREPNIIMVMRGFVGGMHSIRPTLDFLNSILLKDRNCKEHCDAYHVSIEIDPLKFRKYHITHVPAFTFVSNGTSHTIYGDAPIEEAVKVLYEETKDRSLKKIQEVLF